MYKIFTLFFTTIFFISINAQDSEKLPPEHFPPNREFDLLNLNLDLNFDLNKKELFGKVTQKIAPLQTEYDSIRLDAVDMNIEKILLGDKLLKYNYDKKILTIALDKTYSINDTIIFSIYYSTIPGKGIYFVLPDSAYPDITPQIWSQSEMEDARYWYPCHDYPDDFSSSSISITVPDDWTAVSNGVLSKVDSNKTDSTVTFHWIEEKPHVIYLNSIAAGKFEIIKDNFEKIPVSYYVPKKYYYDAKRNFSETPEILKFFSNVTGYYYPWEKLSISAVTNFIFGGMENVSAITVTDVTLHDKYSEPQYSSVGLVAHEIAHQWFGDLLTCSSWSQAWLNEGFARYFQNLYAEHSLGKNDFQYNMLKLQKAVINSDKKERRPTVYNKYFEAVDLFGNYIYARGAAILHMLRGILGDELFFKSIKHYVDKFQFQNVDSHNFENAVREASGKNLNWFFDEWLYKGGHPVFNVNYSYDELNQKLILSVSQMQKVDEITPVYKMPVEIYIETASEKITKTIRVDSLKNTFQFNLKSKPLLVLFDKENFILKELYFQKNAEELSYQLKNAANTSLKIWAAEELSNINSEFSEKALINSIKDDEFWAVRLSCAKALKNFISIKSHTALLNALKDPDARVQEEAVKSLANFKDAKTLNALRNIYFKSNQYYIRAACINSFTSIDPKNALPLINDALKNDSHRQIIARAALNSLAKAAPEKAFDKAMEFIKYGNPHELRIEAAKILADLNLSEEKTVSVLKKYALDNNFYLRRQALTGLGKIGGKDLIQFLESRKQIEKDGRLSREAKKSIDSIEKRNIGSK